MTTTRGTTISLNTKRGFGFIRLETGEDVFFNASGCVSPALFSDYREGLEVEFLLIDDPKEPEKKKAIGLVFR